MESRNVVKLADLVARETGASIDSVMLLRHSQRAVDRLRDRGVTVKDYTIVQPTGSKYDYRDARKPQIDIVAVAVDNQVYAIYRVIGVDKEGTSYSLNVPALTQDDIEHNRPERRARRFKIVELQSAAIGKTITGWERRQRTPVQRSDGAFFDEIEVDVPSIVQCDDGVRRELEKGVQRSLRDSPAARQARLAKAPKIPARVDVRSTAFARNPDVIAEVLVRAKGHCESCKQPAPFTRKSDQSPYLEVHHQVRLTDGGEDTVKNAHALCPNCHRRKHYG